jgi:glycosyltransferase involved in cell wall biosynthesis
LAGLSVFFPAYNDSGTIASMVIRAVQAAAALTPDYEVIVVNDGSPDTEEFERAIKPYLDRIRYLKQENCGASVARNSGLLSARGEFVAFLDADDLWLPTYLEAQMKFLNERGCDLVCADATFFGDAANESRTYMDTLMNDAPPAVLWARTPDTVTADFSVNAPSTTMPPDTGLADGGALKSGNTGRYFGSPGGAPPSAQSAITSIC